MMDMMQDDCDNDSIVSNRKIIHILDNNVHLCLS